MENEQHMMSVWRSCSKIYLLPYMCHHLALTCCSGCWSNVQQNHHVQVALLAAVLTTYVAALC